MIGSRYVPRRHDVPLVEVTQPSGCGAGTSGCAGCGSIPGTGPSGRIDPAVCACKHKGPKAHGPGVYGGTPMSTPDQPATAFIPRPPPPRPNGARPRMPMPEQPLDPGTPITTQGGGYVPPPPPPKKDDKAPRILPPVRVMPKDPGSGMRAPDPGVSLSRKDPSQVPALPPTVMALPGLSMAPNPFAPYCGDGRISPDSEFCREARGQGVSDFCQRELLDFLALPEPKMPLAQWIATRELCDQDALRRAANIVIAKASAGLYRASGAMPNYHSNNLARMFRPSGLVYDSRGYTAEEQAGAAGAGFTAEDLRAFNDSTAGQSLYRQELAQAAAAAPPATPPVDYAALVAGIGTGLGATLGGVSSIVRNANDARTRELELQYGADARAGQLALQRATMEANAEVQRLAAQGTPAANQAVQALQRQIADMNARLSPPPADEGMSDTTKVFLGLGAAAVLAGGFWLATRKDRQ